MKIEPLLATDSEILTLTFAPTSTGGFVVDSDRSTLFGDKFVASNRRHVAGVEDLAYEVFHEIMPWAAAMSAMVNGHQIPPEAMKYLT